MNIMAEMMARGRARMNELSRKRGRRGAFWRMCQCGQEFSAIGRKRKVTRRLAETHIQRCRAKSIERQLANG